eukprot:gene8998-9959_t
MNVFRLTGDLSHVLAILLLLWKIWKSRSCAGISGKSQIMFALVFLTRYLDLVTSFISIYNTTMKIIFIATSLATVYLVYVKFKATYDHNHDTFRVEFVVVPVAGLAILVNHELTTLEVLWTFSIYLESVAILPQLFMISKTGEAESITSHYLFALGSYRALYILNWIYRYHFEGFFDLIAIVAGCVQTVLYCDFFYLYITKVIKGKSLKLPA